MKRILRTTVGVLSLLTIPLLSADIAPDADQQQVISVIKEIKAQQVSIAENQAKIDAKLVALAETVRIAKIYSSRGGR